MSMRLYFRVSNTVSKQLNRCTLCSKEIRVHQKYRNFPLELCPKLWSLKIAPHHVNCRHCQLNWTEVDTGCDKLAMVIGQTN